MKHDFLNALGMASAITFFLTLQGNAFKLNVFFCQESQ